MNHKNIDKNDEHYNKLSLSQKYISDLINDKDNAIKSIKDKYLQICKSSKLRKEEKYNYQIITYPGYSDRSEYKINKYIKEEKMPFGNNKGKLIKDLDEEYVKSFIDSEVYKLNKGLKEIFKKYHSDKINNDQKGGDYIDDRIADIRSDLRKDDIINYCKKFVNYKKALGETVTLQDCYKKQFETPSSSEDRSITEDKIRSKLITFAEEKNTKVNNPIFHSRLLKLIETLSDENILLSKKLILFLIEIGELDNKSTVSTVSSGGAEKKKSRQTKKKKKNKK